MSIWNFLSEEEIEDAEDGELGFAQLVRIAQTRLNSRTSQYDEDDERQWRAVDQMRSEFSMVVLSLGKSYEIEPFCSMDPDEVRTDPLGFKRRLDDYVAQVVVRSALAAKRDALLLSPDIKQKIRTHLYHIKEHLERLDIDDSRRARLRAKIAEFESSLNKERINIFAVARVTMEILSLSANVLALSDSATLQRLLGNMMVSVAEAKAADDVGKKQNSLPIEQPTALPPQKKADDEEEIPF